VSEETPVRVSWGFEGKAKFRVLRNVTISACS
jgi:hypothetical protein